MAHLLAQIARFEAPVNYREIYPWLQRVRAFAALVILGSTAAAGFLSIPGAWIPTSLAAFVAVHAVVSSRRVHSPTEVLVIDAVAIAIGLGISDHAHTALVAAAAYLIATSITFGGLKSLIAALVTFGSTVVLRFLLPLPEPTALPAVGEALMWVSVTVFLGAVALSLMAAATEVHKAKHSQASALEAERRVSEMKNEFVSMITHELRTPLTNISGFADTLQEMWRHLPESDVDEFLRIIVSESGHLHNLVEDVLTIPRLEAGRLLLDPADFDLRAAAFKVVNLLFPEGGERSASVSIGSNVVVHADPNRVDQVLRNLVENARKYGGDTVSVEAVARNEEWQIVVTDNGTGLPRGAEGRVFEAFEQVTSGDSRADTGFGLGLTVARHLVEAMNGRIWYEPGFPIGARFCFTLPAGEIDQVPESRTEVA